MPSNVVSLCNCLVIICDISKGEYITITFFHERRLFFYSVHKTNLVQKKCDIYVIRLTRTILIQSLKARSKQLPVGNSVSQSLTENVWWGEGVRGRLESKRIFVALCGA